jgi:hypothetical protein
VVTGLPVLGPRDSRLWTAHLLQGWQYLIRELLSVQPLDCAVQAEDDEAIAHDEGVVVLLGEGQEGVWPGLGSNPGGPVG